MAAKWLDYVRSVDLNDYALGVSLSTSQNIYAGSDASVFFYPYLTSFTNAAFTDNWFVVGEGDLGIRYITNNDWIFGAVGRIQTQGPGDNESLADIRVREWTLELAPTIGYRGWPIHIQFKTYFEILDRHEGSISQLEFLFPTQWDWGYINPAIEFKYQSSEYSDYYYGVETSNIAPGRPAYDAGSATNILLKLQFGYTLSDHWLLTGRVGLEFLDDEITNSPIIDRDRVWSASLGLAYNADIFQQRQNENLPAKMSRMKFKVSVFDDHIETTLVNDSSILDPGSDVNLEDLLGLSDRETVTQFDFMIRLGIYHRIEASYLDIRRSGHTTLSQSFSFRDVTFAEGSIVDTKVETQILRLAYGYSILKDSQKELGFLVGIHQTRIDTKFIVSDTGQREKSNPSPTLPVFGVFGSVRLGWKLYASAQVEVFKTDFDRYDGSLINARLEIMRNLGRFDLGLGYSYYGMNLKSRSDDFHGAIEFRHHGPMLSGTVHF
jgi:outer membrane protein